MRAAGPDPFKLFIAALVSHDLTLWLGRSTFPFEWWAQAAGELSTASFKGVLGALHAQSTGAMAGSSGGLVSLAVMVMGLITALATSTSSSGEVPATAGSCAALLMSSADFRADLRSALQHVQLAVVLLEAAIKALAVGMLSPSRQARAFRSDRRLAEALLAKLAADAHLQRVRCRSGWC